MISSETLSTSFRRHTKAKSSLLALLFTSCLGLAVPASAGESNPISEPLPSISEVALHSPSPSTGIRLKLHGIEDLRQERSERSLLGENSMEELKKQAQARYLARKLKQDEAAVRPYIDLAWEEARRRELLDPELLIAIMQKESGFRPTVQSRYGAQGLMQVVPRWHRDKLRPSESLFDPEVNVRVGADVLEEYLAQAGGDMSSALKKYSGNARGYVNSVMKESRMLALIAEQATSAQG